MIVMRLSEEEQNKADQAMEKCVSFFLNILEKYQCDSITIDNISGEYLYVGPYPTFYVDRKTLKLTSKDNERDTTHYSDGRLLTTEGFEQYQDMLIFFSNFESIKQAALKEINKGIEIRQNGINSMRKINGDDSVELELDLPESNNRYEIEITEEKGSNIGTINFGERTIRIVSEGEIVLADKRKSNEETNTKTKEKRVGVYTISPKKLGF